MKLGVLPIIMFGLAISIVALSFALFDNYLPNKAETKMFEAYKTALAEANQRAAAEKRVKHATELVVQAANEWKQVVATRTPPNNVADGGMDLSVYPWQFVPDAKLYRNSLQRAVNEQVKKGGIKLPNGGPAIPDPGNNETAILAGFFNYPAVEYPVVLFDMGQITVTGTYDQIIANYESWSKMPHYIVLVDGLQFVGTSPHMTATYNVQMLGFIRGKDIFPPEPSLLVAVAAGRAPAGGVAAAGGGGGATARGGR